MGCVFIPYLGLPRCSRVHTIHVSLPESWAKMKRVQGARIVQRKTRRKRYRKYQDNLTQEKIQVVKTKRQKWKTRMNDGKRRGFGEGVVILHSQWRTRKQDFRRRVMCSVQESHLTVSAFSQEDRRRLPHDVDASFRKMTKKIIDSTQEGPRKSSIWVSRGSLYWKHLVDICAGLN